MKSTSSPDQAGQGAPGGGDLTAPVKLVVWDLDETLWSGTISEGAVVLDPSHVDLVRALNRRGIVNSICSKNDAAAVRERLSQVELWDEFVLASIDWSPKGPRVARIIEDAQLRAENVLFIDDLALNRGEVSHFSPGVQTAGPEIIGRLLALPELQGKDDRDLSRLRQYQLLERKVADRRSTAGSNDAFLRECDIRVGVFHDAETEFERLYELFTRTHQLNFTKRHLDRDEFGSLLADPQVETGYVKVRDRYGDYGICGFYARSSDDAGLIDLLFSCRVLHMGVEQWLYDHLGRPAVSPAGDVASSLEGDVDWITLDNEAFRADGADTTVRPGTGSTIEAASAVQPNRILMVGSCDLASTAQFLGGDIASNWTIPARPARSCTSGHTETIRQSVEGLTAEQLQVVDRLPMVDRGVFHSPVVTSPDYDILVYSVLTDYTQGLYRHRDLGILLPWHQFEVDVTDPAVWPALEARFVREGTDRDFLQRFSEEFEFEGVISLDRFEENIRWLAAAVPEGARIVFVNGAEIPFPKPRETDRHLHHRRMNTTLDRVVASLPNATVCDVRTFLSGPEDFTDNIRHYHRRTYFRMAEEIRASGGLDIAVQPKPLASRLVTEGHRFVSRQRGQARRLVRRVRGGSRRGPAQEPTDGGKSSACTPA